MAEDGKYPEYAVADPVDWDAAAEVFAAVRAARQERERLERLIAEARSLAIGGRPLLDPEPRREGKASLDELIGRTTTRNREALELAADDPTSVGTSPPGGPR